MSFTVSLRAIVPYITVMSECNGHIEPDDNGISDSAGIDSLRLKKSSRWSPLSRHGRNLLKKMNKTVRSHNLFDDGDRICVAVSGGKDSLTLLHLMLEYRRFYPIDFTVDAVHVVSDFNPHAAEIREYLESMFRSLGIGYALIDVEVTVGKDGKRCDPSCFWCSWKRREVLFRHTADNGFSKLALGHHFDDVAETTLLNLIYHGSLETILPTRQFFEGAFDLIRPLFHIREREMVRYAALAGFESTRCVCPFNDLGKRQVMKRFLRDLSKESKLLHSNLWGAAWKWHEAFGDEPLHTQRANRGGPPDPRKKKRGQ